MRILVKDGADAFIGQFDAVAGYDGEADFQVVALRAYGVNADGWRRRRGGIAADLFGYGI